MQSSDFDRTLNSAAINLAAIYPNERQSTENLPKQVVPIHTIPRHLDNTLMPGRPCPALNLVESQVLPKFIDHLFTKHKTMLNFLREQSGLALLTVWEVHDLYDALFVQEMYNKT